MSASQEIKTDAFQSRTAVWIFRSILVVALIAVALVAIAQTFTEASYEGIADGMRYLASGHSLISEGHGFNNPIRYDQLQTSSFPDKPYPYPSQLVQLLLGSLVGAGASPNVSTIILAGAFAFAASFFVIFGILRISMRSGWALACTAFIALAVPQYRQLSLNFTTEPWMMLFGLAALWALLKGRYFVAGACLGFGFFFRAQILSLLPACIGKPYANRARIFGLLTGLSSSAVFSWLALKLSFPKAGESTSGFYGRVFLQKYSLSPWKAFQIVGENLYDFKWLWFSLLTSFALLLAARSMKAGAVAREVTAFYATSTVTMALFAFYMAGTVGDGVSDRYFLHLICLFWVAFFLLLNEFFMSCPFRSAHLRFAPAAIVCLLTLFGASQVDVNRLKQNIKAEDFPSSFFQMVPPKSIIMVSYGTPVISLQVEKARIVNFPPFDTFIAGDNRKVDFLFLDAKSRMPEGWQQVWNSRDIRDNSGVIFRQESSFESPLRSSRLFRRSQ